MTSLKILLVFSITIYYSYFIDTSPGNNENNTTLTLNHHNCKEDSIMNKVKSTNPTLEEIIQALELQIVFWKTASKEDIADNLSVTIERIKSIPDTELNEIRLDNMWLYENMIKSLRDGKTEFEVIATKDHSFKISFKEKVEGSLALIMSFKYENDNLIVDKKKLPD